MNDDCLFGFFLRRLVCGQLFNCKSSEPIICCFVDLFKTQFVARESFHDVFIMKEFKSLSLKITKGQPREVQNCCKCACLITCHLTFFTVIPSVCLSKTKNCFSVVYKVYHYFRLSYSLEIEVMRVTRDWSISFLYQLLRMDMGLVGALQSEKFHSSMAHIFLHSYIKIYWVQIPLIMASFHQNPAPPPHSSLRGVEVYLAFFIVLTDWKAAQFVSSPRSLQISRYFRFKDLAYLNGRTINWSFWNIMEKLVGNWRVECI